MFISIYYRAPPKILKSSEHLKSYSCFQENSVYQKACIINCCILTKELVLPAKSGRSRPSSGFWIPVCYRKCTKSFFYKICFLGVFPDHVTQNQNCKCQDAQIHRVLRPQHMEFSEICGCSYFCGIRSLNTRVMSTPLTTVFYLYYVLIL